MVVSPAAQSATSAKQLLLQQQLSNLLRGFVNATSSPLILRELPHQRLCQRPNHGCLRRGQRDLLAAMVPRLPGSHETLLGILRRSRVGAYCVNSLLRIVKAGPTHWPFKNVPGPPNVLNLLNCLAETQPLSRPSTSHPSPHPAKDPPTCRQDHCRGNGFWTFAQRVVMDGTHRETGFSQATLHRHREERRRPCCISLCHETRD